MSTNWPQPGINHVPSYQQSAIPFVTRSLVNEVVAVTATSNVINVKFPFVTRFFAIKCDGNSQANLRFGFTENGVRGPQGAYHVTGTNNNYFVVKKDTDTPRLEIRCSELFFAGDGNTSSFELIAGLTTIPTGSFAGMLTGSNGFQGVG